MAEITVYRYFLDIEGERFQCNPLGGDLSLKYEQESSFIFFREKLSGSVTFKENDFKELLKVEQSLNRCIPIFFEIEEQKLVNAVYEWVLRWKGVFSVADGKNWDLSNCEVTFNIAPFDKYTLLLEEYEREHNVLEVEETFTATTKLDLQKVFEFGRSDYSKSPEAVPESYGVFLNHYYKEPNFIGVNKEYKRSIYFREVDYTLRSDLDENGDQVRPNGSGWVVVEELPDGRTKWGRPPQIPNFVTHEIKGLIPPYLVKHPEIKFIACSDTVPENYLQASECLHWEFFGNAKVIWEYGSFYFDRCRKLIDVVSFLVEQTDPNLLPVSGLIQSTFLTEDINPTTFETNQFKDILIAGKSDIKRYYSSEPQTKAKISLKSMLEELNKFNLFFYVNPEGFFQLEHLSFFEKWEGVIDTTLQPLYKVNLFKKSYEYLKNKMPRYEVLQYSEPANPQFFESTIEYEGSCINKNEGENKVTYQISRFSNDIESIMLAPDEYSDTGFTLLCIVPEGDIYRVANEVNFIDGRSTPNYHLSAVAIMERYYRHGRVLKQGLLNGELTTFLSIARVKKQVTLQVYKCHHPLFNEFIRFVTELSIFGKLLSSTHNLKTDVIEVDIVYEISASDTTLFKGAFTRGFTGGYDTTKQ